MFVSLYCVLLIGGSIIKSNMATMNTLEKKVISIDTRLGSVEKKIDTLYMKFEGKLDSLVVSIEDLAISVKNGFDRIDERFEQVDKRFNQMDNRFDRIENISIGNHERRIENIEDDIRILKTKAGLGRK